MPTETVKVTMDSFNMEDLVKAADALLHASEDQFNEIKKEKWFNRVWDMVTFSQKKDIRLAEQIQTLSQAQNIMLQMLPRLAVQNAEIAALVEKEQSTIEKLSKNDLALLRLYKNLHYRLENERLGVKKSQTIASLSETDKLVLSSCLRTLAQEFDVPSELQQCYFNVIHNYIGCESSGQIVWDEVSSRPEEVRKLILQCCLEYIFLYHSNFELTPEILKLIDNFDIGPKTINDLRLLVGEMVHARGAEGIIAKYTNEDNNYDISDAFEIDCGEVIYEEYPDSEEDQLTDEETPEERFARYYSLAESGNAEAQCKVGICYYSGEGIEKDLKAAIEWYRKSAEQGYADAQNRLGVRYNRGDGVEENDEIAIEWFRKAAEQGHAKAQCNLGKQYYYGWGTPEDNQQAEYWFSKSAKRGYAEAQYYLGLCYQDNSNYERAFYWFHKAAEQEDAAAQLSLGICYEVGSGTNNNIDQAIAWIQKAADNGNSDAQIYLGNCYLEGIGVTKDDEQAAIWVRRAADQGNAAAQNVLGHFYYEGIGVTKDDKKAVDWFRKAAEQGNCDAQFSLGACYQTGRGVKKDYAKAISLYKQAAEQDYPTALLQLGICYMYGKGVVKNLITSEKYFYKAIEFGDGCNWDDEPEVEARAHYMLAKNYYTQNVRDNLDINALDVVNCVPVVNIASWAITGAISVDEKAKLRKFLKTEEGQIMLQHCEIAANLDYKLAKDMLKKIKKCL